MKGNVRYVRVKVVLDNKKALRAFGLVLRTLADVAEDMPWRDDVKQAVKAARYARKNLKAKEIVSVRTTLKGTQ
jgi:hypothetical protein